MKMAMGWIPVGFPFKIMPSLALKKKKKDTVLLNATFLSRHENEIRIGEKLTMTNICRHNNIMFDLWVRRGKKKDEGEEAKEDRGK